MHAGDDGVCVCLFVCVALRAPVHSRMACAIRKVGSFDCALPRERFMFKNLHGDHAMPARSYDEISTSLSATALSSLTCTSLCILLPTRLCYISSAILCKRSYIYTYLCIKYVPKLYQTYFAALAARKTNMHFTTVHKLRITARTHQVLIGVRGIHNITRATAWQKVVRHPNQ